MKGAQKNIMNVVIVVIVVLITLFAVNKIPALKKLIEGGVK